MGGMTVLFGVLAVPFTYSYILGKLTNDYIVFNDPPDSHPDTIWETSGWCWGWMEPVMGVGCFLILCLQLTDVWLAHLGRPLKPDRDRDRICAQIVKEYGT